VIWHLSQLDQIGVPMGEQSNVFNEYTSTKVSHSRGGYARYADDFFASEWAVSPFDKLLKPILILCAHWFLQVSVDIWVAEVESLGRIVFEDERHHRVLRQIVE
jgi:hypothetical protein